MTEFGWFASLEEFSPAACLEQVDLAEEAGFDSVWVNDHFHPWFDQKANGESANGGTAGRGCPPPSNEPTTSGSAPASAL